MGTVASRVLDFEAVYQNANGDPKAVPWADEAPHPALVAWMNAVAPSILRCGARVLVVGCGLGDDAAELHRRGYDVTAFDISSTAIEWAQRRYPACSFTTADLFDAPPRWRHRFDLVVEIHTLQALDPARVPETVESITDLLAAHGQLLVIARHTETSVADDSDAGPPWPLTTDELLEAAHRAGLEPSGPIDTFTDDETPPVARLRAVFQRMARIS